MRTAADEKLDEARAHVRQALGLLHDIVVEECGGYDEFRQEFKDQMEQGMADLLRVKRWLEGG